MAGPLIAYLLRDKSISLTIASNSIEEATVLANNRDQISISDLNVDDTVKLAHLVRRHDIVIRYSPILLID